MNNKTCLDCGKRVMADSIHTCSPQLQELTDEEINELYIEHGNKDWDWQTEDRQNTSPPHIVDSGASVKTLADYIEQETREEMLRNQMYLLHERVKELEIENTKLKREVENLMDGRC